jgi:drug/metabolite transporter (DMT)-like permease
LLKPLIELISATALWGFGFTAAIWALKEYSAVQITFLRFSLAVLVGAFFLRSLNSKKLKVALQTSCLPALFIFLTLLTQTEGLKSTSATKSAFITTLYVVIVPLMMHFRGKESLNFQHWLSVFGAILGTALISKLEWSSWTAGDSLTLLTAFFASLHIISVGTVAQSSSDLFLWNWGQSLWCALFCVPLLFGDSSGFPPLQILFTNRQVLFGVLSLGIGSSLLAFYLQARAQRHLSASVSSLLFLLESPFSFLFAYFLLNERLTLIQGIGASVLLASCWWASTAERTSVQVSESSTKISK